MSRLTIRTVAVGALIVAIGVGITSNVLFLAAFQFRVDWLLEPTRILGAGGTSAELLRWAAALDLIGYYLATGVLAYALWRMLRPRNPIVADLSVLAALGYTFAGGAGAAVLAMVGPMLMHDYMAAARAEQAVIAAQFEILFEVVWRAIWQFLDAILLAAWWLGTGFLVRADHPGIARLSMVLSAVATAGAISTLLGLNLGRDAGLALVFSLWTIWWISLLVLFLRQEGPVQPAGA
jgi:hypothetical protein